AEGRSGPRSGAVPAPASGKAPPVSPFGPLWPAERTDHCEGARVGLAMSAAAPYRRDRRLASNEPPGGGPTVSVTYRREPEGAGTCPLRGRGVHAEAGADGASAGRVALGQVRTLERSGRGAAPAGRAHGCSPYRS